jgi:hypothetical protein
VTFAYWRLACILTGVLARLESGARGEAGADTGDDAVSEFRARRAACVTLAEGHAAAL